MSRDTTGKIGTGQDLQVPAAEDSAQPDAYRVGVLLLADFNCMATAAAIDPLRAVNYLSARKLYDWTFFSLDGKPVRASNGLTTLVDASIGEPRSLDLVFVCASWTPEAHGGRRLFAWLREQARAGAVLGGIDTGAIVLARGGLLDGYQATAHYEHLDGLEEIFARVTVRDALFVFDRDRLTCCGGSAATDMSLEIIRLHHGLGLANGAARYIFHDRLRAPNESQLHPRHEPVGASIHRKLTKAIILMEQNIEEPLALADLAAKAGLSMRHIERLFRDHTGVPPIRYYLDLRLDRARSLITQTDLQVVEVSIACGFANAEHFSRAYKKRFGLPPRDDRVAGRIPFQFRTSPLHAAFPVRK